MGGAPRAVTDTWTAFLGEARAWLTQVRVLTSSKSIRVSVATSRELTGAGDWLTIDESPRRFEAVQRA